MTQKNRRHAPFRVLGCQIPVQEMIGDTEDLTVEMFDTDSESDFELLRGTLQFYVMGNGMDISEFVDMDGTVYSIVEE